MKFEPMINARLKAFKTSYDYDEIDDNSAFELFVNNAALQMHQPGIANIATNLLTLVSVGSGNDMGVDGIAIKINGIFVVSKKEVDDIIKMQRRINVEFLFMQSKYKEKLDSGEYGKYIDGVADFLNLEHHEPHNEKIQEWLDIKDYLFSDDIIMLLDSQPIVRLYYVIFGTWKNNEHIIAKTEKLKDEIAAMNTYGEVFARYIDSSALKKYAMKMTINFR